MLLALGGLITQAGKLSCPHCGKNVKLGLNTCHHCGRDVESRFDRWRRKKRA